MGTLEPRSWGIGEEQERTFRSLCPGGKPHLEAEPCWGVVVPEKVDPAPPAQATETF